MRRPATLATIVALLAMQGFVPLGGVVNVHAGAATQFQVQVSVNSPAGRNYEIDAFYPQSVTVHRGDTIIWKWATETYGLNSWYAVVLLPAGVSKLKSVLPAASNGNVPQNLDTDDGPTLSTLSTNIFRRVGCGNSGYYPGTPPCTFTGRVPLSSGTEFNREDPTGDKVASGARIASYAVKVNAPPGLYHVGDLLHDWMTGTIRVVAAQKHIPSAADLLRQGQVQYSAALRVLLAPGRPQQPARTSRGGHTTWRLNAGGMVGHEEVLQMLTPHLVIHRGDTVIWKVSPGDTVTFPADSAGSIADIVCEGRPHDVLLTGELKQCPGSIEFQIGADEGSGVRTPRPTPGEESNASAPAGKPYRGGFYNSGQFPSGDVWSATFPQLNRQC